ncbi:class I SAM-dependent methyltransferase [Erysipelothrix aquatica]|uniref:class I SAM-dependent methyltransferase n=1 Tax=Erysipelothrix aquatica TaxID=2683714 RepID=UPI001357889F|nr:class I SAM-dependent methyltransferase [Erysipelothrix aquatica]
MKEKIYDDIEFYTAYSSMLRSEKGLLGAGEWHALKPLLPDFTNKSVLDLGCGFGWHCHYAVHMGAKYVVGVDESEKMLRKAEVINSDPRINYRQESIESSHFDSDTFDVVMSSLVFHYLADYATIVDRIYNWLKQNGMLVFTVEHPVFTSHGSQDWIYNEDGEISHFPIDNYYYEGLRETQFLRKSVIKYHRTVVTYIQTLIDKGFTIKHVVEPKPDLNLIETEGMKDEMRRPMMFIITAQK